MECVEMGTFLGPLLWSALMLYLISKMDRLNGFESGLAGLFSPPIFLSLFLAFTSMLVFYDAPPPPEHPTLGDIANNIANPLSFLTCRFMFFLNVLNPILAALTVYKLFGRYFPNELRRLKEVIRLLLNIS